MTTSFDIYLAKSPLFIAIGAFLILAASESFESRELVQDAMAHLVEANDGHDMPPFECSPVPHELLSSISFDN
ncbi:hypothetical protein DTO169E5_2162 [Paecilomyces variotii]|nr:hypothetical protein DTO169E5_2162 [Paecilomyces variotii]